MSLQGVTRSDYFAFLALFTGGVFTLTDTMHVTPKERRVIEAISDECLLTGSSEINEADRRVMISNFDEVIAQRVPFVHLIADDGILIVPAYQFVIIPAKEA